MNINRIGIALSLGAICAAMTFASCDNHASDPGAPGANNGRKGMHVLTDDGFTALQIDRSQLGGSQIQSDEVGTLTVSGLTGGDNGVSSAFAPAVHWHQTADISLPADGGGDLTYSTYSAGTLQSTLNLSQDADNPASVTLTPSFTQAQGEGSFDVEIYDDGALVAAQRNINTGPTFTRPCAELLNLLRTTDILFLVKTNVINICEWRLLFSSICCKPVIVLSDGTEVEATEVRFIEVDPQGGPYVYTSSDEVRVTGNVDAYTIRNESAGN